MMKMSNLAWMLLGVAVGTGSHMCYCEVQKSGGIKPAMDKMMNKMDDCCSCSCSCK
mgnify:CR=1 FL=1